MLKHRIARQTPPRKSVCGVLFGGNSLLVNFHRDPAVGMPEQFLRGFQIYPLLTKHRPAHDGKNATQCAC